MQRRELKYDPCRHRGNSEVGQRTDRIAGAAQQWARSGSEIVRVEKTLSDAPACEAHHPDRYAAYEKKTEGPLQQLLQGIRQAQRILSSPDGRGERDQTKDRVD